MATTERHSDGEDPLIPSWHPTPQRYVLGLILVEVLLLLSEQVEFLPFNREKGATVLVAVAVVLLASVGLGLWYIGGLVYRRPFQFGIGTLLLFTAGVAIACSWFSVQLNAAKQQHAVVRAIPSSEYRTYGYVFPEDSPLAGLNHDVARYSVESGPNASWPRWLCDAFHLNETLGKEFFADIRWVDLRRTPVTDATLEQLKALSRLQQVQIGAGYTNAGLAHLRGLTHLRTLYLGGDAVTDEGLAHLAGLRRLQFLRVAGKGITNEGLRHMQGLTALEQLTIDDSSVTDRGLEYLKGLRSLHWLSLTQAQLSRNAKQALLQELPKCDSINN